MESATVLQKNQRKINSLTNKIYILIILNALDSFFTYIGVKAGYAEELNPIALPFVQNHFFMVGIKVVAITILLSFAIYFIKNSTKYRMGLVSIMIGFAFYVYVFVTLNHLWVLWQMATELSKLNLFVL